MAIATFKDLMVSRTHNMDLLLRKKDLYDSVQTTHTLISVENGI